MLEPIVKGLVKWIYGLMIDLTTFAANSMLGVMNMDLEYFETTAPIVLDIVDIFIALGWALLIGNLVFQALKAMMSGAGFEAEDPKILFLRTFVFSFLLLASRQICDIGLSITSKVIDLLEMPDAINVSIPDETMFSLGGEAKWLLVVIIGVILMIQLVKLLFEIGERYVITSVLTFFSPLAFAMGGSKNTHDIFKGWCRMYASMLVMMIMNIVFLKLILSAMSRMTSGGVLLWLVFVVALTRVARKIDSHIGKIGLNPAQTGPGAGSKIPGVMTMVAVRAAGSIISRSMSNSQNNSNSSNNSRTGGRDNGRNSDGGGTSRNSHHYTNSNSYNGRTNGGYNNGTSYPIGGSTGIEGVSMDSPGVGGNIQRPAIIKSKGSIATKSQTGRMSETSRERNSSASSREVSKMPAYIGEGKSPRPPIERSTSGPAPVVSTDGKPASGGKTTIKGGKTGGAYRIQNGQKRANSSHSSAQNAQNIGGSIHQSSTGNMSETTRTTVSAPVSAESISETRKAATGGMTVQGGSVVGQNSYRSDSGNVTGEVNIGGDHIAGGAVGGSVRENTVHTAGEVHTQSQIVQDTKSHSEHFGERHSRSVQMRDTYEKSEQRVNHEYKHGRYNPAAANKRSRRTFYKKDITPQRRMVQRNTERPRRGDKDSKGR